MKLKLLGLLAFIGGILVALVLMAYGGYFLANLIPLYIQQFASAGTPPTFEDIISVILFLSVFVLLVVMGLMFLPVCIKGIRLSLNGQDDDKVVKLNAKLFAYVGIFGILTVIIVAFMNFFSLGTFEITSWSDLIFSAIIVVLYIVGVALYKGDARFVSLILFAVTPLFQLIKLILGGLVVGGDTMTQVFNILQFVAFALFSGGAILLYVFAMIGVIKGKGNKEANE